MRFLAIALAACSSAPMQNLETRAIEKPEALADRDGDGVPDKCDYCPGAPGYSDAMWVAMGNSDGLRGCPWSCEFGMHEYDSTTVVFGSKTLVHRLREKSGYLVEVDEPLSQTALADVAGEMRGARFFVIGVAANEKAAEAHAKEIADALILMGVSRSGIEAHGSPLTVGGAPDRVQFAPAHRGTRDYRWNETAKALERIPFDELPGYLPPCE